jgi:hypothetical protein
MVTFQGRVVLPSPRSSRPRRLLDFEDGDTAFLRNFSICSPANMVLYPRIPEL